MGVAKQGVEEPHAKFAPGPHAVREGRFENEQLAGVLHWPTAWQRFVVISEVC
jgi:hypothetical protein